MVAVTNFCSDFNKNIQTTWVTADELAAQVKHVHLSQIKQNKNTAAALHQQCFVMIEQSSSLSQAQKSSSLTKDSDYELNDDGIARSRRRSPHEDGVDAFANN